MPQCKEISRAELFNLSKTTPEPSVTFRQHVRVWIRCRDTRTASDEEEFALAGTNGLETQIHSNVSAVTTPALLGTVCAKGDVQPQQRPCQGRKTPRTSAKQGNQPKKGASISGVVQKVEKHTLWSQHAHPEQNQFRGGVSCSAGRGSARPTGTSPQCHTFLHSYLLANNWKTFLLLRRGIVACQLQRSLNVLCNTIRTVPVVSAPRLSMKQKTHCNATPHKRTAPEVGQNLFREQIY